MLVKQRPPHGRICTFDQASSSLQSRPTTFVSAWRGSLHRPRLREEQHIPPDHPPTVPVVIDSRKDLGSFQMTRCSYLSIEATEPLPNWSLDLGGPRLPILLLNLEAVVYQPLSPQPGGRFESPEDLENLFQTIESAGLAITIQELWLPNFVFRSDDLEAGHVYRILDKLFAGAAAFRDGRLDLDSFTAIFEEYPEGVIFSEEETRNLSGWWARELGAAIETYPKNSNLALEWTSTESREETELQGETE
jgi:hypothetical protein